MASALALLIFIVLTGVALLHAYWAFGGLWPGRDEISLARTVVGSKGISVMPSRRLTLVIAVLIWLAGALALMRVSIIAHILPLFPIQLSMLVLAAIFIIRGSLSFTAFFRNRQAEEPFLTLDRRYFGPMCLALGVGFGLLLLS